MPNKSCIKINFDQADIHLPYRAEKYAEGETFPYVSLLEHPDLIDSIPELTNEPVLKDFIGFINRPDGMFETFRVIHWENQHGDQSLKHALIGLHFRDRSLFGNPQNLFLLAHAFAEAATREDLDHIPTVELDIQRATMKADGCQGWVADFLISGLLHEWDEPQGRTADVLALLRSIL
ncbi:hypothetical protein [Chromobacterium haemolyticum]|uniref:hypothetical protein n=1 Tax=Chromobacterium TaxID=535 RepID=UPI004056E1EF